MTPAISFPGANKRALQTDVSYYCAESWPPSHPFHPSHCVPSNRDTPLSLGHTQGKGIQTTPLDSRAEKSWLCTWNLGSVFPQTHQAPPTLSFQMTPQSGWHLASSFLGDPELHILIWNWASELEMCVTHTNDGCSKTSGFCPKLGGNLFPMGWDLFQVSSWAAWGGSKLSVWRVFSWCYAGKCILSLQKYRGWILDHTVILKTHQRPSGPCGVT